MGSQNLSFENVRDTHFEAPTTPKLLSYQTYLFRRLPSSSSSLFSTYRNHSSFRTESVALIFSVCSFFSLRFFLFFFHPFFSFALISTTHREHSGFCIENIADAAGGIVCQMLCIERQHCEPCVVVLRRYRSNTT